MFHNFVVNSNKQRKYLYFIIENVASEELVLKHSILLTAFIIQ